VQATADAVRRPLLAGVLVLLVLLCAADVARADDGGAAAPTADQEREATTERKGTTEQRKAAAGEVILKRGDRGSAVRQVQTALGIAADGVFGAQTEQAVKRFQRSKGLTPDGIVGPQTRDALGLKPFARSSVKRQASDVKLPLILRQIAECESGGDPTAVSPGGQYRGKYQFSVDTWRGLGGKGDPAKASEAEQDRLALKLYRRAGTSPWPNCP
jgi:Transglycosylase-like domain/Putative peptidoglycan binding domain